MKRLSEFLNYKPDENKESNNLPENVQHSQDNHVSEFSKYEPNIVDDENSEEEE